MADLSTSTRPVSFLPSIKCSDCGAEIEISKMADHVCLAKVSAPPDAVAPPTPTKSTKRFFDRAASLTTSMRVSSGLLKPGRNNPPPPRIDTGVANKPFLGVDPLTPSTGSRSPSPLNPRSKSPQPFQGQTSPLLNSPPSSEFSSYPDSEFQAEQNKPLATHDYPESDPRFAPLSPRPNGGNSVLERMNTIAPGPFDARPRTPKSEYSDDRDRAHKRTNTLSSLRSQSRSRLSSRTSNHSQDRPGTAHSQRSRSSVRSNEPPGLPQNPRKPGPPPRPARPGTVDTFLESLQQQGNQATLAGVSSFVMQKKDGPGGTNAGSVSLPRRPSEIPRLPPPSAPADEPSPEWWDTPKQQNQMAQENAKRFPRRTSSRSNISFKSDLQEAPPVPPTPDLHLRNLSHAPSDSASSEDSSSGFSNSSRSTPPTSAGSSPNQESYMSKWDRPSHERSASRKASDAGLGGRNEALRSLNSNSRVPQESQAPPQGTYRAYTPTSHPESLPPPRMPPIADAPESPLDPAIQRGLFNPRRPSDANAMPEIQSVVESANPAPPVPAIPEDAKSAGHQRQRNASVSSKRPNTSNGQSKGPCRGCGEAIIGKSVKAADGRLTGRWHKECFVCKTCAAPFVTADFYVFENAPYCAQHWHALNGSLCRGCRHGIEGAYLETERRQKFHPRCLCCDTCRVPLQDDYFEVAGIPYCERHAWHAARQTGGGRGGRGGHGGPRGHLGVGLAPGRNPERRRTRLMMMAPAMPQR